LQLSQNYRGELSWQLLFAKSELVSNFLWIMSGKQKTRKSAAKRFKITATGKVLHRGHGVRHIRSSKSNKRLRAQSIPREVIGRMKMKVKKMMGAA